MVKQTVWVTAGPPGFLVAAHLKLCIGPARDLNNHVEDGLFLVGVEGHIVERGDGDAILLDVDAVLKGVRSSDFADAVSHGG